MNCKDAMAALVASIENGDTLPPDVRDHLKLCPHCRALLDSTKQVESALLSEPAPAPAVDESKLHGKLVLGTRKQFYRRWGILMLISLALLAPAASFAIWRGFDWREAVMIGALASVFISLPAIVFLTLITAVLRDHNGNRIYKRLKAGKLLSGVCLGLSEATGVSVVLLRLAFLLLGLVKGVGLWLYIVLDLAMPVHPDDRQNLLRFRIRRWFQRRSADANAHAR